MPRSWRHNFTGVRVEHGPGRRTLLVGAIVGAWIDLGGVHDAVDHKAAPKNGELNLDADWQDAYRHQVECYPWLLRGRGSRLPYRAWFVYANGMRDGVAIDDFLWARTKPIACDGSDGRGDPTLRDASR